MYFYYYNPISYQTIKTNNPQALNLTGYLQVTEAEYYLIERLNENTNLIDTSVNSSYFIATSLTIPATGLLYSFIQISNAFSGSEFPVRLAVDEMNLKSMKVYVQNNTLDNPCAIELRKNGSTLQTITYPAFSSGIQTIYFDEPLLSGDLINWKFDASTTTAGSMSINSILLKYQF